MQQENSPKKGRLIIEGFKTPEELGLSDTSIVIVDLFPPSTKKPLKSTPPEPSGPESGDVSERPSKR